MKILLSLYRKSSYTLQSLDGAMMLFSIIALALFCLCNAEANAQPLTNPQTFTTPGTYTSFTVPSGVTSLTVECWGAGGAGSRKTATAGSNIYSAGGGGGNYTKTVLTGLTSGSAVTVVVGAGGLGYTSSGASATGNPGGYSAVFQGSIIAQSNGGGGGVNLGTAMGGGGFTLAGAATPLLTHVGGNSNLNSNTANTTAGGGAGSMNDGGTPASGSNTGGAGGSVGGGAGGDGGKTTNQGNPGLAAGGGGAGAKTSTSSTFSLGGDGGAGMVVITFTPCTNPVGTGIISGATSPCPGTAGVAYSMSGISNVTAYSWSVSGTGNSVASGNGTSSITINWGNTSGTYTVSGTPQNSTACVGTTVNYSVVLPGTPASPASITGPSLICQGSDGAYSTPDLGFTYNWSVNGSGWSLNSANGSNSISIIAGTGNGDVSVTASNACFASLPKTTTFSANPSVPNTPGPIVQY